MLQFLPMLILFKIYLSLPLEDRVSLSHTNVILYYTYGQYKKRRHSDRLSTRIHTVSCYRRRRPIKAQLFRLQEDVNRHTHLIKQLSIKFELGKKSTNLLHTALCLTLKKVSVI